MEELPHKLKLELAMSIHKKMYSTVTFLFNRDKAFIAWFSTVVHQMKVEELEIICRGKEDIMEIFFLVNGTAAYVLPRFQNKKYIEINMGAHFGHVELFGRRTLNDPIIIQKSN
jgi:hypothetical protein